MHLSHRRAFTLLEMSVVLVVIGLLIGGALTAQSFIKTSKLSSIMTEAKYYMNAWGQFQERYQSIPGDYATASSNWSTASNGDGNGQLMSAELGLPAAGAGSTPEVLYTFQHLSLAGFIEGSYNGAALLSGGAPVVTPGTNLPKSSWPDTVYFFDHTQAADGWVSIAPDTNVFIAGHYPTHMLRIGGKKVPGTGPPREGILTPPEAFSIDSKFDDGSPTTGMVMSQARPYMSNVCIDSILSTAIYYPGSVAAGQNRTCLLLVKMP